MHFFFMDASALIKRYAPEGGSLLLDHLFANVRMERLYLFNVGIAEVASILVRKRNGGLISATAFAEAMTELVSEIVNSPPAHRMVGDHPAATTALALIDRHSINATDAILLRLALDVAVESRSTGDDLVLVACDHRLLRAAQAEGLATFNPETQSQAELDLLL